MVAGVSWFLAGQTRSLACLRFLIDHLAHSCGLLGVPMTSKPLDYTTLMRLSSALFYDAMSSYGKNAYCCIQLHSVYLFEKKRLSSVLPQIESHSEYCGHKLLSDASRSCESDTVTNHKIENKPTFGTFC